ncbi:MAG: LysR family transcriptional regulator [Myxococcota bacterium]
MDLAELEAFIAVVETGSVASASARLHVPRSTLTRRLDALEARAGSPLLHRESQGAAPTVAGEQLLPRARELLSFASSLLRQLSEPAEVRGVVRMMLCSGLPPMALGHSIAAMRSMFPGVDYVVETSTEPLSGSLEGRELVMHWGQGPKRADWRTESLVTARVWAMASQGYLAKNGQPTSVEELAEHVLLSWRPPGERHDQWPLLDGGTFEVKPALTSADPHLLRHVARRDEGIMLVPDVQLAEPEVGPQLFELVLPDEVGEVVNLSLSGPARVLELPRIQAVVSAARSLLAKY